LEKQSKKNGFKIPQYYGLLSRIENVMLSYLQAGKKSKRNSLIDDTKLKRIPN